MGFFADLTDFILKRLFVDVRKAIVRIIKKEEEKTSRKKRT